MTQATPIAAYSNGGYEVAIYPDGTKVRHQVEAGVPPVHPEQMDLKVTDWCDAGCAWCHEKSTRRGGHGDVDAMLALLAPLPAGVEIAIGGGDPLSHPEFERLVTSMRDMGLIANVTVNGRHLDRHRPMLDRLIAGQAIHGVGVSVFDRIPDWDYPHMVVHMIAGVDDPALLDDLPSKKVLVLGYKDYGRGLGFRGKHDAKVTANIAQWYRELLWLAKEHHLSFDTLAISQLQPERLFKTPELYARRFMGEEGQFSMYVDGVRQEFALSSYSAERHPWSDIVGMFQAIRTTPQDTRSTTP